METVGHAAVSRGNITLVLLRVVTGALFLQHGLQKHFAIPTAPGDAPLAMWSLPWTAGMLELVGGVLLIVGLLTRITAVVLALEMLVAYVMVHAPQHAWPVANGGELALLYALVFIRLAVTGPGRRSLDALFDRGPVDRSMRHDRVDPAGVRGATA